MDKAILGTLLNWGETKGWELWSDGEGVAQQMQLLVDPASPGYRHFKMALTRLEKDGCVDKTSERQVARATWSITEHGRKWLKHLQQPDDVEIDVSARVGKRITADNPVSKQEWAALMTMWKAGEVDIAFHPKKKTGGSGS